MRNLRILDARRRRKLELELYGEEGDETCGVFFINGPCDRVLRVIASSGDGWDHVSVSLADRCPRWEEMECVKRLFFKDDECAMQLHVPTGDHISHHPFCLHLWRPHGADIPLPPYVMVAAKTPEGFRAANAGASLEEIAAADAVSLSQKHTGENDHG